jgi:hypothetical protein
MVLDDAVARLRMAEFLDHLPGSPEMLAADLNCFPRPPEVCSHSSKLAGFRPHFAACCVVTSLVDDVKLITNVGIHASPRISQQCRSRPQTYLNTSKNQVPQPSRYSWTLPLIFLAS